MDAPTPEEATAVIDEDIEEWAIVTEEERAMAALLGDKRDPFLRAQENLQGRALDKFMDQAKEDIKSVKEEVKHFFGKASEFTKKVFKKGEQPQASSEGREAEPKPEEPKKGIKLFGAKIKMGLSKIFTKKPPPVQFE